MAEIGKKEKIELCLKLADFGALKHERRRQFEWKVSVGYWALLATLAYALAQSLIKLSVPLALIFVWISLVGYGFWLSGVFRSNTADKSMSDHYLFEAERLLLNEDHEMERRVGIGEPLDRLSQVGHLSFIRNWAMRFQFGTAVLLAVAISALILIPETPSSEQVVTGPSSSIEVTESKPAR